MTTKHTYFDEYGELNVLGRMLYAEAVRFNKLDKLPDVIYNHVLESPLASAEIIDLYSLIENETYEDSLHPFFDMSDKSIGGDLGDINRILQQLKAEATLNLTYEKVIEEQFAYRSSAAAAGILKVEKPISEQLILENFIDFKWQTNSNKGLVITLENQHGRLVKERLAAGTKNFRINLGPKSKFPSGLYYWKLALRGGKPVIGKVYVYQG